MYVMTPYSKWYFWKFNLIHCNTLTHLNAQTIKDSSWSKCEWQSEWAIHFQIRYIIVATFSRRHTSSLSSILRLESVQHKGEEFGGRVETAELSEERANSLAHRILCITNLVNNEWDSGNTNTVCSAYGHMNRWLVSCFKELELGRMAKIGSSVARCFKGRCTGNKVTS